MSGGSATIFVCTSCRGQRGGVEDENEKPGAALVAALEARVSELGVSGLAVEPVECLAVCKRPCTLALAADGKWTYLIGDLDPIEHVDEIVAAASAYRDSENGIVAWRERPATFRRGVIARVPPLGWKQPPLEEPS